MPLIENLDDLADVLRLANATLGAEMAAEISKDKETNKKGATICCTGARLAYFAT